MSERLLKHFDLLATAPDGVARLRELILTLAVQGKLVPQDPNDEPASVLLQRIRAEKERLIAEGKIKRDKSRPPIADEEKPFELPPGWEWMRLGNLLPFRIGRTPPSKDPQYWTDSGHSWVSIADMEHFGVVQQTNRALTKRGAAQFGYESLPVGTLLMSFKLTIGKIAVLGVPAYHNEAIVSFHPLAGLETEFLKFVLPSVAKTGSSKNALMGQTLNTESLSNLILAIPPTDEQSRIVACIEGLMRLCDALEANGRLDATQHAELLHTLLGTLTDSATPEELAANWQRVTTHFDLLLDRPEAVDALEQTILQLAVRGLLVHQDANDDPASVLLQHIRAEKDRLIAERKIKRDKPLPPIADAEKPFELPHGWEWVRLSALATFENGDRGSNYPSRSKFVDHGIPFINAGHLLDDIVDFSEMNYISLESFNLLRSGKVQLGDILYCLRGSLGKFGQVQDSASGAIASSLVIIRLVNKATASYVMQYLKSPLAAALIKRHDNGTAQPNLGAGDLAKFVVPLPPLSEQSRIIGRVEQLRQLCGDLRQRLTASRTAQGHLAESLVESLAA